MGSEFVRASQEEYDSRVVTYKEVPVVQLSPDATAHIVTGKNATLSFATVAANANTKIHSHPAEQFMIVVKGELDAVVAGKLYRVKAGDVVKIPGGVEHAANTLEQECQLIEVFAPARKDFEEKLQQAIAAQK